MLREENMMLRMEILKLKKALFMKQVPEEEILPQTPEVKLNGQKS
jgi:regulator of replication initiation timing